MKKALTIQMIMKRGVTPREVAGDPYGFEDCVITRNLDERVAYADFVAEAIRLYDASVA